MKRGPSFASGVKPTPRVIANSGETVELRCRAVADQQLDIAYTWTLNGLQVEYREKQTIFFPSSVVNMLCAPCRSASTRTTSRSGSWP